MTTNRLNIAFGARKNSSRSESPPLKRSRRNSNRRPLRELSPSEISPVEFPRLINHNIDDQNEVVILDKKCLSGRKSIRRPLSELSPNAVSKPLPIPQIAIEFDDNDDVFDGENKENFPGSGRKVLFPSFGTSPGHALKLSQSTIDDLSPTEIEDQCRKKLGQGSFGTVFLGVLHGERVAMKIIKRRDSLSLDNELNAQALDHRNVTKIKTVQFRSDSSLLIMEYVGQNNLQALLHQKCGKVKENRLDFLQQICSGLKHCHEKLIAHLDLKPANILITSKGQCKIADFGCSRAFKEVCEQQNIDEECVGTPGYQAPEIFKDKIVTLKSDVFSLGILMWQLLTGEPQPYPEWHPHTIIFKVVTEDVRPCIEPSNNLTKFKNLYSDCWNKNPSDRPDARVILQSVIKMSKSTSNSSVTLNVSTTSRKSSGLRI